MAERLMTHREFIRLERAFQAHFKSSFEPWPTLRYQNETSRTCRAVFPGLSEEEMNVLLAELLLTRE